MNDCQYCEHRGDHDYCCDCVAWHLFVSTVAAINEVRRVENDINDTKIRLMRAAERLGDTNHD